MSTFPSYKAFYLSREVSRQKKADMWFSKIGNLEDDSDLEDAEIGKAVSKALNNKKSNIIWILWICIKILFLSGWGGECFKPNE